VLAGATRPLIFVDIDGVLIPFRGRSAGTRRSSSGVRDAADGVGNPLLDRLDPADGRRLLALPGELVWASTWMAEANEVVAPRLGLPVLPVVDWPDDDEEPQRGVHWKPCLSHGGRPDVRSSGWTMRPRTPTGGGSPRTTRSRRCCSASIRTWD
jgi:hypothetical protein